MSYSLKHITKERSLSLILSVLITCLSQTSWAQNNSDVPSSHSQRGGASGDYIDLKKFCSSQNSEGNLNSGAGIYTYAPLGLAYDVCMKKGWLSPKLK